jgi:hypothetical protein
VALTRGLTCHHSSNRNREVYRILYH